MAIIPPGGISAITPSVARIESPARLNGGSEAAASGGGFENAITGALDRLDALDRNVDKLSQQAATGELKSVEEYMMAATEAQLTTQLTVAVRNRAIESFNEIMRMQI